MASSGGDVMEEIKSNLIETIRAAPSGKVPAEQLLKCLPGTAEASIVAAINVLQEERRLKVFDADGQLLFGLEDENARRSYLALGALTAEERLIHQTIEAAGAAGVWIKTIQQRTNLATMNVNNIIQGLERKGLIKRARNRQKQRKKVYILASIEEKRSMIENDDGEVDQTIIDYYCDRCVHYIKQSGLASTAEVCAFLRENSTGYQDISEPDAQRFLDLLVFDGKIEAVHDYRAQGMLRDLAMAYRPVHVYVPPQNGMTEVPCSACPVASQCAEGNVINPASCEYLSKWLVDAEW